MSTSKTVDNTNTAPNATPLNVQSSHVATSRREAHLAAALKQLREPKQLLRVNWRCLRFATVIARMVDHSHVADLAEDIARDGFQSTSNGITVLTPIKENDIHVYTVVDGAHRLAALKRLDKENRLKAVESLYVNVLDLSSIPDLPAEERCAFLLDLSTSLNDKSSRVKRTAFHHLLHSVIGEYRSNPSVANVSKAQIKNKTTVATLRQILQHTRRLGGVQRAQCQRFARAACMFVADDRSYNEFLKSVAQPTVATTWDVQTVQAEQFFSADDEDGPLLFRFVHAHLSVRKKQLRGSSTKTVNRRYKHSFKRSH